MIGSGYFGASVVKFHSNSFGFFNNSGIICPANIVILLSVDDPTSNISCQMDPTFNDRLKNLKNGGTITIKGICNGSKEDDLLGSLDVMLNRCIVVN